MAQELPRKLAQKIINKDKWWDILSRFIDVLRINIFIVDSQGAIILPPEEGKYGGRLLTSKHLGYELLYDAEDVVKKLEYQGRYMEYLGRFHLRCFAIPIMIQGDQTIAYMIVGPVILNKRHDMSKYLEMAEEFGVDGPTLMDEINEVRVVSNIMMNSILDLLSEIVRDNIDLSIKEEELDKIKTGQEQLPVEISEVAKEIYSTIRLDELLVTLLDVALKMTNTECGSIMVVDDEKGDLTIKASRGLNAKKIGKARMKVGEGIAGLAAKEKTCFVINEKTDDNRIKPLLKRPDIKQSLVMPLLAQKRVFGVLNVHTKKGKGKIKANLNNLEYLSKLISSAF